MKYHLFIVLTFIFYSSCGEKKSPTQENKKNSQRIGNMENGIYHAILKTINPIHSGLILSSLTIAREDNELTFHVRFSGGSPEVMHLQNIHIGLRCPDLSDDLNQDGIIDSEEGKKVYKEVIIPLDDDLNSQHLGLGIFPASDYFGQYRWSRSTSVKNLLEDLYQDDINSTDQYVKLKASHPFDLTGRAIVISGIQGNHQLPDTIDYPLRSTPQQSLPVACGILKKITFKPGNIDKDQTDLQLPDDDYNEKISEKDDGADFSRQKPEVFNNYGDHPAGS
jgi:hypothetical protein